MANSGKLYGVIAPEPGGEMGGGGVTTVVGPPGGGICGTVPDGGFSPKALSDRMRRGWDAGAFAAVGWSLKSRSL